MDMSKLPKLSQTPSPPADTDPPAPQQHNFDRPVHEPGNSSTAEAWISIALGLLLLYLVPTTLQFASSKAFGTKFEPFADPTRPYPAKCDFVMYTDGTKTFYRNLPNFWSDLVVTLFAFVLLLDGLVLMFARNRGLLQVAFGLTCLATAGNLIYMLATLKTMGLPLISALAVIFGVYIAMQQWRRLGSLKIG